MAVDYPEVPPPKDAAPEHLLGWASVCTEAAIAGTWRPGHTEHAPLLVRLDNGREIFFETISEATSPSRFFAAFIAVGCAPMRAYGQPQVRQIVSALVRAARLSEELDERDFWEDTGSTFLRGCVLSVEPQPIALDPGTEQGRLARYRTASNYDSELSRTADDTWPRALLAVDTNQLLVPRGPFLAHVGRRRRGQSPGTVNAQMRRLGWELRDLRPRKPQAPRDYPRPHLRLWAVPNGWDGRWVEIRDGEIVQLDFGPVVPPGPAEHARDRTPDRGSGTQRDPGTQPSGGFEDRVRGGRS
jgi:hypothetical protein